MYMNFGLKAGLKSCLSSALDSLEFNSKEQVAFESAMNNSCQILKIIVDEIKSKAFVIDLDTIAEYFAIVEKMQNVSRLGVHSANYFGDKVCKNKMIGEILSVKKWIKSGEVDDKRDVESIKSVLSKLTPIEIKAVAQGFYDDIEKYFRSAKQLMKTGNWAAIRRDNATERVFDYMKQCRDDSDIEYHIAHNDFINSFEKITKNIKKEEILLK